MVYGVVSLDPSILQQIFGVIEIMTMKFMEAATGVWSWWCGFVLVVNTTMVWCSGSRQR